MADGTKIEWTDATWNPVTGCSVVSPGCTNCYAMRLAGTRMRSHPSRAGLTSVSRAGPVWNGEVRFNDEWLAEPMHWRRPRRIFVCAHGDLFHDKVPDEWIDRVFAIMALCPQHTFQVLTKRPERMRQYIAARERDIAVQLAAHPHYASRFRAGHAEFGHIRYRPEDDSWHMPWPLPNVWLGVSVENQETANERIPLLLATPAAKCFVSAEPLLGPVSIESWLKPRQWTHDDGYGGKGPGWSSDHRTLDWVICGGESGPDARPMHPDWVRSLRDQCADTGVPFHFKQWGEWAPESAFIGRYRHHADTPFQILETAGQIPPMINIWKVGKRRAGAILDGREHQEFPA